MPITHQRTVATIVADPSRVSLSRRALAIGGVMAGIMFLWAAATTWYIVFRDEIAQSFLARQAELRFTYEDRVAGLQQQLEREITQNLVERNGFSARVDGIAVRQAEIERRQARLTSLSARIGQVPVGQIPVGQAGQGQDGLALDPAPSRADVTGSLSPGKPAPLDGSFGLRLRPDPAPVTPDPPDRLSAIERSLHGMGDQDLDLLRELGLAAGARTARIRAALAGTGLDLRRVRAGEPGMGGPLVPLPPNAAGGAFAALAAEIEAGFAELDGWLAAARTIPLGRPLAGPLEQTSPFGYRLDPFTRSPALHTGMDLRAEYGSLVRATAPGRVVAAEYTGGYGNMIEIDHGEGLVTRYGHLSAYLVAPGTRVEAGQPIARAGSTGRSTGSHLHYETRINGEPVNPERFLQAGRRLALSGAGSAD